jgi:hypothetical protein
VVNRTLDFEHVGFIVAQFCFPLYTFVSLNLFCLGLFRSLGTLSVNFISLEYHKTVVLQQKLAVDDVGPPTKISLDDFNGLRDIKSIRRYPNN